MSPTTPQSARDPSHQTGPAPGRHGARRNDSEHTAAAPQRLMSAMVEAVALRGYAHSTVADVLAVAGASRSTFYEYFADKDDCFQATGAQIAGRLQTVVENSLRDSHFTTPTEAVIEAIVGFVSEQPTAARLLMSETLCGGPGAMDVRDGLIEQIERALESEWLRMDSRGPIIDLSPGAIVGGLFRLMSIRMSGELSDLQTLPGDLSRWIFAYTIPRGPALWREPHPMPAPRRTHHRALIASMPSPQPLPRGRHGLQLADVARIHRERILFATAETISQKSYAETTVADIISLAGVSRKAFYALFKDKQQAASEAHALTFHQALAVVASAFFSSTSWPERVWKSTVELLDFMSVNPVFAHLGVIDLHAVGPETVSYLHDRMAGFALFLEGGYALSPEAPGQPALTSEMLCSVSFELCYRELRGGRSDELPRLAALFTYMYLAPFMGPAQASDYVSAKITDGH